MAATVMLTACKSSQPAAAGVHKPPYPSAEETDEIEIEIVGDVQKPGVYRVARSVSLASLPKIAGGWTGRGGGLDAPPTKAYVTNPARQGVEKVYSLRRMSQKEKEVVWFRDGDVVYFPRVFF